jgi:hypothetical protein
VRDWDAVRSCYVHRATLGEGVRRWQSSYRIKVGEVGDWAEQALDVAGVEEIAQEPRDLLRAHRGHSIHVLIDVEQRDDLVDGENAEARKCAEDGEHTVGDHKVTS